MSPNLNDPEHLRNLQGQYFRDTGPNDGSQAGSSSHLGESKPNV